MENDGQTFLHLVIGGSGSGKSVYAENEVLQRKLPHVFYIADMMRTDQEAGEKIRKHVERRSSYGWETIERDRDLGGIHLPTRREETAILLPLFTGLSCRRGDRGRLPGRGDL